jgi:putative FmdB family regulatory protein
MPFYEYRPKSGACDVCGGCFVDLQKMSDPQHKDCPDCGQACERVLSAPIVSVRGSEYRAAANKENRTMNLARAKGENEKLRISTLQKYGQMTGHTHNCALSGCYGDEVRSAAQSEENGKALRFGGLPHLVGVDKK